MTTLHVAPSILREKCCDHSSAFIFGWIFFTLAGNKTHHKSLNEFEFWQNSTTDLGVSCPLTSEKSMNNVVTALACSFLIGSSLFLQVTRTTIKARMGSKFGQTRAWTVELAAFEHLEKSPYTYNGRNVVTTLVLSFSNGSSSFLQIRWTTILCTINLAIVLYG